MKFILLTTHLMQGGLKMNENKYELSYTYEGDTVKHTFSAECNIYEMAEHLKRFLLACSWLPSQVNSMIKDMDNED